MLAAAIGAASTFTLAGCCGPAKTVGYPVAHAQASAGGQALPGKVLPLLDGIAEQQAVAQITGDACAQCGATAMAEYAQPLPSVTPHQTLGVVEAVFVRILRAPGTADE